MQNIIQYFTIRFSKKKKKNNNYTFKDTRRLKDKIVLL